MHKTRQQWFKGPFTGLILALQLGAFGLVPMADGILELASITEQVHVESSTGSDCLPGHNHFVCQLCRVAGTKLVPGVACVLPATIGVSLTSVAARDGIRAGEPTWTSSLGARAPPLV